jgi:ABC-type sugar transport system permease subunit
MALPFLVQAAIFYVYLNSSTVILSFLKYDLTPSGDASTFVWFDNFGKVIARLFIGTDKAAPEGLSMVLTSFVMYGFILCVVTPVVIFFSFYIYKKFFMAGFFRVILYMPQIISSVVYVTLYKMMLGPKGFFGVDIIGGQDVTLKLCALVFYVFWTGFGTNILLMSGAMGGIDDSVVEACYLDGCNMTKEFIYVTLPSIYPTITTFVVLDITTLFTNTMNLHLFFGLESNIKSIGYFLEINTIRSPGLYNPNNSPFFTYTELSALGVMITCITAPACILVRKFMERVGPSED